MKLFAVVNQPASMDRHPADRVSKSQQLPPSTKQQRSTSSSRQQQSRSQQRDSDRHQRAALLRAKFGANSSQIKLTVFIILVVALVLSGIAFFSTNWLEVRGRYYGSKFKKLGLWRVCFNSFSAPDDDQFKKFYVGCRWIFADEYRPIRKFLLSGS